MALSTVYTNRVPVIILIIGLFLVGEITYYYLGDKLISIYLYSFDDIQQINIFSMNHHNIFKFNQSLPSYRNSTMKKLALQKLRNGDNATVFIFHARKAGGSTLKKWMRKLANKLVQNHKNDSNFIISEQHTEFYTFIHDKHNTIDTIFKNNPLHIFSIVLRHPIERILSQYEFEWRWGCQGCAAGSKTTGFMKYNKHPQLDNVTATDVHKYLHSNIVLSELLDQVGKNQNITEHRIYHRINFNAYLNNYYLWMFCCADQNCNIQKDFIDKGKIYECMEHAIKMIMSFDIVLVEEWLNDIRTQLYVNKLFFGDNIEVDNIVEISYRLISRGKIHKKRGKDLMYDDKVYEKLMEMNKWDLKFYEFVKQIVFEREMRL
eukprot:306442_1